MNPSNRQVLQYLTFAASDDGADTGSWEAMASVQAADLPAVRAELQTLMLAAQRQAPGTRGAEEEGGVWDAHCHEQTEGDGWLTITLTLTGPWDWGQALVAQFSDQS